MKIITRIVPILLFLVLVIFLAIGLNRDPKLLPSELIDRQMPEFSLQDLYVSRGKITEADLLAQVRLVNVFGSWCAACVTEHGMLMDIAASGEVSLIGVNWRDTRDDAFGWLGRFGDPYDRIIFDNESELAIELGVTGAPETFIVDPEGRIRYKHVGPITADVMADKIRPVLQIIAEEAE